MARKKSKQKITATQPSFDVWNDEARTICLDKMLDAMTFMRQQVLLCGVLPPALQSVDEQIERIKNGHQPDRLSFAVGFRGTHFEMQARGEIRIGWHAESGFEVEAEVNHGSGGATFDEIPQRAKHIADAHAIATGARAIVQNVLYLLNGKDRRGELVDHGKVAARDERERIEFMHFHADAFARDVWKTLLAPLLAPGNAAKYRPRNTPERKAVRSLAKLGLFELTERRGEDWTLAPSADGVENARFCDGWLTVR